MPIQPYLSFEGRADEAIEFYKKALGARVEMLMRFKEAPDQSMISPGSADKVMHAALKIGDATLLMSDGRNTGKPTFQGISLTLYAKDAPEAEKVFNALAAGGEVTGVIPEFLTRREVAHPAITEMVVTDSMHSRKQRMFEAADAFVSLPGGLGTLDETIEIITWHQLGLHAKPVLICDVAGSAAPFLATIDAAIDAEFAGPEARRLYQVLDGVPAVLERLEHLHRAGRGEAARL